MQSKAQQRLWHSTTLFVFAAGTWSQALFFRAAYRGMEDFASIEMVSGGIAYFVAFALGWRDLPRMGIARRAISILLFLFTTYLICGYMDACWVPSYWEISSILIFTCVPLIALVLCRFAFFQRIAILAGSLIAYRGFDTAGRTLEPGRLHMAGVILVSGIAIVACGAWPVLRQLWRTTREHILPPPSVS